MLQQLKQAKMQQKNAQTELSKSLLAEGVGLITREILESAQGGRIAKKLAKTYLEQQQRVQFASIEQNFGIQFDPWLESVKSFLSNISIWKRDLKEPNSQQLIKSFDLIYEYARLETRIRQALAILKGISNKPLIYNKDIPQKPPKEEVKELILPPGSPYTGFRKMEDLLKEAKGYIKIIDPYVDEETLDLLLDVPKEISILILTEFIGGEDKEKRFIKLCQKFKAERPKFNIRKCGPRLIHDRFILTHGKGWSIGTSIKDIGKKLSMIAELSDNARGRIETLFDELWNKSKDIMP